MPKQRFDETEYVESFDYEEYFEVMDISEEERAERVKLARDFAVLMLFFFASIDLETQSREYQYTILEERCKAIAEGYVKTSDTAYLNDWARKIAIKATNTTYEHLENPVDDTKVFNFEEWDVTIPQNEYWTSPLRALLIAGGMASVVGEYGDLLEALESGATTKTWHTERDKRVRPTHREAENQTVSIFEPFIVGGWELMFPGDATLGAPDEELCSCRCHATYE
jgi:hypothetical protein